MKDIQNKEIGDLMEMLFGIPNQTKPQYDQIEKQLESDYQEEAAEDFDKASVLAAEKEVVSAFEPTDSDDDHEFEQDPKVGILSDFDIRKAIVYAEIVNPKYF